MFQNQILRILIWNHSKTAETNDNSDSIFPEATANWCNSSTTDDKVITKKIHQKY